MIAPSEWRTQTGLSLSAAAKRLGVSGKNPARTLQRYETGEREPPLTVIRDVAEMSGGVVTLQSWIEKRKEYEQRRRAA